MDKNLLYRKKDKQVVKLLRIENIDAIEEQQVLRKQRLNHILAENTGKTIEEICKDTERDNFMTATEALQYGLIDQVIEKR